jgi:hypothetical protein
VALLGEISTQDGLVSPRNMDAPPWAIQQTPQDLDPYKLLKKPGLLKKFCL